MFGPLRQIGYVVSDIEMAMRHWVDVCGVGPWFYFDRYTVTDWKYEGRAFEAINVSVALSNWGELQIELIQQRCETPSLFRDFLAAGREGVQHWAVCPGNYDEMLGRALAAGHRNAQSGATPRGRAAFLVKPDAAQTVIELSETGQARLDFAARIRDAAREWDGRNPILRQ